MAAVADTKWHLPPSLDERIPSAWLERFTPSQREQLLRDDFFAGTSIALILVSIFTVGLLLSMIAVLLAA